MIGVDTVGWASAHAAYSYEPDDPHGLKPILQARLLTFLSARVHFDDLGDVDLEGQPNFLGGGQPQGLGPKILIIRRQRGCNASVVEPGLA